MTRDQLLDRINKLTVWKRGAERAPHKPLLLLLALGRLQHGGSRLMEFGEIERKLADLLVDFGPPRPPKPELPFFHLQSDKIWESPELKPAGGALGNVPRKTMLREHHVRAGFTLEVEELLKRDPGLVSEIVQLLLEQHFPETLHSELLNETGVALSPLKPVPHGSGSHSQPLPVMRRDPAFRHEVLHAYEHTCAFCGFNARLGTSDLGLEAAHLKWHQAGGPSDLDNGIACCSLHHHALDRGALGLDHELRILVSAQLSGTGRVQDLFVNLAGKRLRMPNRSGALPKSDYIGWHLKEVFRKPHRDL